MPPTRLRPAIVVLGIVTACLASLYENSYLPLIPCC